MAMNDARKQFRFTGWHMLGVMVAFFAVILTANMAMLYAATSSWSGLVTSNGYVASQHFNADAEAAHQQSLRGWTAAVSSQNGAPEIALTGPDGAPLTGLEVSVAIGRPVHSHDDQTLSLQESAPGVYRAQTALAPGRWRMVATASNIGAPWRGAFDLTIPAKD